MSCYLNDIERTGWWGGFMSLSSRGEIVVVWGCGRRSSLRSTLPLCEMHRAAKLVRDLANQRWI